MNKPAKCVFFGSDPIALPALETIRQNLSQRLVVDAVYTQPDRRRGRGKKQQANAIKQWAEKHGIAIHQPEKLLPEDRLRFEESKWDLALVMAYGKILKRDLLETPRLGFYNLHASLLPKLRGASPIETAIVTGEKVTGVTLMKMVPALDAGPVADCESLEITREMTAPELRNHIADASAVLVRRALPELLGARLTLVEQDANAATYCRLIDKNDGWLDFDLDAEAVVNHVRGFLPWPGALFQYGDSTLKVGSAEIADSFQLDSSHPPGVLMRRANTLFVTCGKGAVRLLSLQKPGGKMLETPAFLNGFEIADSTRLSYPKRHPLVGPKYFRKAPDAPPSPTP